MTIASRYAINKWSGINPKPTGFHIDKEPRKQADPSETLVLFLIFFKIYGIIYIEN